MQRISFNVANCLMVNIYTCGAHEAFNKMAGDKRMWVRRINQINFICTAVIFVYALSRIGLSVAVTYAIAVFGMFLVVSFIGYRIHMRIGDDPINTLAMEAGQPPIIPSKAVIGTMLANVVSNVLLIKLFVLA